MEKTAMKQIKILLIAAGILTVVYFGTMIYAFSKIVEAL